MKSLALAVVLFATVAFAATRDRRQILADFDVKNIPNVMKNKDAVKAQVDCVTATDTKAAEICDKVGKKMRELTTAAIQKGDCPTACTEDEKVTLANILVTIRDKYPDLWKQLQDFVKPTPEQKPKMEEFLKKGTPYA